MKLKYPILIAVVMVVSGCATPGPYAEVTGERAGATDLNEESVRIVGVNGKLDLSGSLSVTIDPGKNMLLVRTTRKDGRRMSPDAMLPLNAKACTRYYVIAKHEAPLTVEPWSLEIKKVEPIGECLAQYPGGVAPK